MTPGTALARMLLTVLRVLALLALAALLGGQPAAARLPPPEPTMAIAPRPDGPRPEMVVEQLRLRVPAAARDAWLEAERGSWEPWLARQDGFLGRDLYWDPEREEATLLIRWASRGQWKAIETRELERVQADFERIARRLAGQERGNPFPLVFEGELRPQ
jgi:uncharacterized protein (TIGR03792 family)